jgi:uncharacterized protein Veg
MANTQQTLKKIRNRIKSALGDQVELEDHYFTFDRDTQKIVTNREIDGWHFIFDLDGNELSQKRHRH